VASRIASQASKIRNRRAERQPENNSSKQTVKMSFKTNNFVLGDLKERVERSLMSNPNQRYEATHAL